LVEIDLSLGVGNFLKGSADSFSGMEFEEGRAERGIAPADGI
jgi:hypothetical protein